MKRENFKIKRRGRKWEKVRQTREGIPVPLKNEAQWKRVEIMYCGCLKSNFIWL